MKTLVPFATIVAIATLLAAWLFIFASAEEKDLSAHSESSLESTGKETRRSRGEAGVVAGDAKAATDLTTKKSADSSPRSSKATKKNAGIFKVMSRDQFVQNMQKLGFTTGLDLFEGIHDIRPDEGALTVIVTNADNEPVRRARVVMDPSRAESLQFHVTGRYSPRMTDARSNGKGIARLRHLQPDTSMLPTRRLQSGSRCPCRAPRSGREIFSKPMALQ